MIVISESNGERGAESEPIRVKPTPKLVTKKTAAKKATAKKATAKKATSKKTVAKKTAAKKATAKKQPVANPAKKSKQSPIRVKPTPRIKTAKRSR